MHFPGLTECAIPSSTAIAPFLEKNPTIATLHVLPCLGGLGTNGVNYDADAAFEFTSQLAPVHMPNLEAGPLSGLSTSGAL
jgi:hypothetical protein